MVEGYVILELSQEERVLTVGLSKSLYSVSPGLFFLLQSSEVKMLPVCQLHRRSYCFLLNHESC